MKPQIWLRKWAGNSVIVSADDVVYTLYSLCMFTTFTRLALKDVTNHVNY